MATTINPGWCASGGIPIPNEFLEPRWYAAYTCANREKRVAEHLGRRSVEHFFPAYETVRRWKDRRAQLQLPLFPGYVFVCIPLFDRLRVLEVPGVVRLVGFNGLPAALPASEIETLRRGLGGRLRAQPHPYLTIGRRVLVKGGPLAGLGGILLRRKGLFRLVVSVELIQRSVIVDVDAADVAPQLHQRMPS